MLDDGADPRQEDYLHGHTLASAVYTDGVTFASVVHQFFYGSLLADSERP
jgi:hypothetical protein